MIRYGFLLRTWMVYYSVGKKRKASLGMWGYSYMIDFIDTNYNII